jgi:hypothetical protein
MAVPWYRLLAAVASVLLLGGGGAVWEVQAQPDSVRTEILEARGFSPDHSPRGALWRSLAVPGWGQLYNRQYVKIPFVYAGFGALGTRVYLTHREYLLFKRAHLYARGPDLVEEGEGNPYQEYQEQYNEVTERLGGERMSAMREQRDRFRRQRNLAVLGTGLYYVLTVLDAYVSAHLLTFDVGEELSLRVRPTGSLRASVREYTPNGSGQEAVRGAYPTVGKGPGVQLRLQF